MANMQNLVKRSQNLVTAPLQEFTLIMGEQIQVRKLLKDYLLPYFIIYAITSYLGNIVFGPNTFRDGSFVVIKMIVLMGITFLLGLYTTVYVLYKYQNKIGFKTSRKTLFIWLSYSSTPMLISLVVGGLIPRIANLIYLFGLYSFYLLWVAFGLFYESITEKREIIIPICSIIAIAIFLIYRIPLGFLFSIQF